MTIRRVASMLDPVRLSAGARDRASCPRREPGLAYRASVGIGLDVQEVWQELAVIQHLTP